MKYIPQTINNQTNFFSRFLLEIFRCCFCEQKYYLLGFTQEKTSFLRTFHFCACEFTKIKQVFKKELNNNSMWFRSFLCFQTHKDLQNETKSERTKNDDDDECVSSSDGNAHPAPWNWFNVTSVFLCINGTYIQNGIRALHFTAFTHFTRQAKQYTTLYMVLCGT